jgi:translation initiation factor 2 subunit 2
MVINLEKDYKTMLDRAFNQLPEPTSFVDRFTIPRANIQTAGRKTVITNFKEIADELRRDPDHLLKFLTGELATLANIDGSRAFFQGKFSSDTVKTLLEIYTNKYVICPVCRRPDTQLMREKRLWFLQCEACGARSSIGAN